jgi:hypothetical protein
MLRNFLIALLFIAVTFTSSRLFGDERGRHEVPDEKEIARTTLLVKEIYGVDLALARTGDQKTAMCAKFLDLATASGDDLAAQYVLLRQASGCAIEAKNADAALAADDEACRLFQMDRIATKSASIEAINKLPRLPTEAKSIAVKAADLADEASRVDEWKTAIRLCGIATENAKQAKDIKLAKQFMDKSARFGELEKEHQEFVAAMKTLDTVPDDANANLTAGRYLCFTKETWDAGLSHLAKGSDDRLKELASLDLKSPNDVTAQVALGDKWWGVAELRGEPLAKPIQSRARYWYRKALPNLAGFTKSKILYRLKSADDAPGTSSPTDGTNTPGSKIDLLRIINPEKNALAGQFSVQEGKLITSGKANTLLEVPLDRIPSSYELVMQVKRLTGAHVLGIGLVLGNNRANINLDFQGRLSGIDFIDGEHLSNRQTQRHDGTLLPIGKPATIRCLVRPNSITVDVDDQRIVDWQGEAKQLANSIEIDWPGRRFYIWSDEAKDEISRLELRPLISGLSRPIGLQDRIAGSWKMDRLGISSGTENDKESLLEIPAQVRDEYAITATVTRERGNNCIGFLLSSQGRDFAVQFDAWDKGQQCSGISYINGATFTQPNNPNRTRVNTTLFRPDKPVRIEIVIKRGSIKAYADGQIIVKWQGDFKSLGIPEAASGQARPGHFYITTHQSSFRISSLDVRSLSID